MRTVKSIFVVFICLFCCASSYSQFTPNTGTPAHYYSTYPSAKIGIGSAFNSSVGPSELLHIKNGNLKVENSVTNQGGTYNTSYLFSETFTTQISRVSGTTSVMFYDGKLNVRTQSAPGVTPYLNTTIIGPDAYNNYVGIAMYSPTSSLRDMCVWNLSNSSIRIGTNSTERMVIDAAGKVTIANQLVIGNVTSVDAAKPTLATDYKLYVEKGIIAEKVKTAVNNTTDWADHVFATDYKLRSILEMEKYVLENKHLPGVPSAEQVVKEGVDMAKMDAKLLEKIEEMALYIIQLKKENERIKEEVELLKSSK